MKRFALIFAVLLLFFAAGAFAGVGEVFGAVKGWIGGNAVALIISAILAIGGLGVVVARYTPVIGAVGMLLVTVELVLKDNKLTKDEVVELKEKFLAIIDAAKKAKKNG